MGELGRSRWQREGERVRKKKIRWFRERKLGVMRGAEEGGKFV